MTVDVAKYRQQGYLCPIPVYNPTEVEPLRQLYWRLRKLLPPGVSTQEMDWWHGEDRELWAVASEPRILDLVEPILGPDFYIWGSQFFSKDPGDEKTTPWHQDAFFWPLAPHNSVTVWVAFEDSDAANGAMKVIPGTHRAQHITHEDSESTSDVLPSRATGGDFSFDDAVHLELKAGQVSLHDDNILHGSDANDSDRLRCGLTLRYSSNEVKVDLSVWPFFKAFQVRGVDRYGHNPAGTPPTDLMRAYRQVTAGEEI
ncbi:MAG: phytanoyl-CoA dioxygenase family protein [Anaerolineae bacterium]|nr:phytanoyl-CoA dioxygenase family protein [Anaerolineae bacterium]